MVTGVPNSGKSEWIDALLCNLNRNKSWTFALCSMENKVVLMHPHLYSYNGGFLLTAFRFLENYEVVLALFDQVLVCIVSLVEPHVGGACFNIFPLGI